MIEDGHQITLFIAQDPLNPISNQSEPRQAALFDPELELGCPLGPVGCSWARGFKARLFSG